jgi:hypothetical protein
MDKYKIEEYQKDFDKEIKETFNYNYTNYGGL